MVQTTRNKCRGGGSNPIFANGKMCLFPFFPMRKNGKKSIWKKREKYSFPSISIYFFPIFPMGKMGKDTIFPWVKMGLDPPPQCTNHLLKCPATACEIPVWKYNLPAHYRSAHPNLVIPTELTTTSKEKESVMIALDFKFLA